MDLGIDDTRPQQWDWMGKRPAICARCQPLPAASTPFTCLALRPQRSPCTHTSISWISCLRRSSRSSRSIFIFFCRVNTAQQKVAHQQLGRRCIFLCLLPLLAWPLPALVSSAGPVTEPSYLPSANCLLAATQWYAILPHPCPTQRLTGPLTPTCLVFLLQLLRLKLKFLPQLGDLFAVLQLQ